MSYLPGEPLSTYMINNTGETSVKGRLVEADSTSNQVVLTDANSNHCIGVIAEAGITNGNLMKIVLGGVAEVLLNDNLGSTSGDWAGTGEAGYAIAQVSPPAAPTHFQEIGHFIETVAAGGEGTHVLARLIMHFN